MSKYFAKAHGSRAVRMRNRPDTSDIHLELIYSPIHDTLPQALVVTGKTCNDLLNDEIIILTAKPIHEPKDDKKYASSCIKEIDVLLNCGVFMSTSLSDTQGHLIYVS